MTGAKKVTIYWKGIEAPSVFAFAVPTNWDPNPNHGLANKFWNIHTNDASHYVNLDATRHVVVEYAGGESSDRPDEEGERKGGEGR